MHTVFISEEIEYNGTQLRSHWIFSRFGLLGDAAIAFLGPARVSGADLVDWADRREDKAIYSPLMLHLVIEHFDPDLPKAVLRQRLLVAVAADRLTERGVPVRRRGDDLYVAERKLSVSIATRSVMSSLIHLGINVQTDGTPVPTAGLAEWSVDPADLGLALLDAYKEELAAVTEAVSKVRSVP